jgi:hypothetical protein
LLCPCASEYAYCTLVISDYIADAHYVLLANVYYCPRVGVTRADCRPGDRVSLADAETYCAARRVL